MNRYTKEDGSCWDSEHECYYDLDDMVEIANGLYNDMKGAEKCHEVRAGQLIDVINMPCRRFGMVFFNHRLVIEKGFSEFYDKQLSLNKERRKEVRNEIFGK